MVSVFTPTYNRKNLLPQLYNSLERQTNKLFEWIIIDDGSIDNTTELIDFFRTKSSFPIKYKYQENSGKHIAINQGVTLAEYDIFLMVDSDDFISDDAIELTINYFEKIRNDNNICGVCFNKANFNGINISKKRLQDKLVGNLIELRYIINSQEDKAEVFKTSVLKEFPFPNYLNEKFCMETLIWNRISKKYDILFSDKTIYFCEYLKGGLSDNLVKIRMNSPKSTMLTYLEMYNLKITFVNKIKAILNFWRFSYNDKTKTIFKKIKMLNNKILFIYAFPGYLLFLRDKWNVYKKEK